MTIVAENVVPSEKWAEETLICTTHSAICTPFLTCFRTETSRETLYLNVKHESTLETLYDCRYFWIFAIVFTPFASTDCCYNCRVSIVLYQYIQPILGAQPQATSLGDSKCPACKLTPRDHCSIQNSSLPCPVLPYTNLATWGVNL